MYSATRADVSHAANICCTKDSATVPWYVGDGVGGGMDVWVCEGGSGWGLKWVCMHMHARMRHP